MVIRACMGCYKVMHRESVMLVRVDRGWYEQCVKRVVRAGTRACRGWYEQCVKRVVRAGRTACKGCYEQCVERVVGELAGVGTIKVRRRDSAILVWCVPYDQRACRETYVWREMQVLVCEGRREGNKLSFNSFNKEEGTISWFLGSINPQLFWIYIYLCQILGVYILMGTLNTRTRLLFFYRSTHWK